jgi:orotate phosphoribosyltransferase
MRIKTESEVRSLLVPNAGRLPLPDSLYADIARTGALLRGHFALQSGHHSEYFLRFSQLGWDAEALMRVAELLLEQPPFKVTEPTFLCSEAAGLFLGTAVQRRWAGSHLAVLKMDARKRPTEVLREGVLPSGGDVIVVDDVVTQGRSLEVFLKQAQRAEARVKGVLTFAVLKPDEFKTRLHAAGLSAGWLVEARWPTHLATECPLCARGGDLPLPAFELI